MSQQYDPAQQLPPSGWYPDPVDTTQERFWDGSNWTTRQRPLASEAQYGPPSAAQPWSGGGSQAGVQAPYQQTGYQQTGYQQAGYQPTDYQQAGHQQAGYQMQGYSQYQPQGFGPSTADGVPLSGWWRRVGATVLDTLILAVLVGLATIPFIDTLTVGMEAWMNDLVLAAQTGAQVPNYTDAKYGLRGPLITIYVISEAIGIIYSTAMLVWKSATVGQLAAGIRVVPKDQGMTQRPLPFGTALLRNVAYYALSAITITGLINVLFPLWNRRRQTLHDMIARTQVVKVR